MPESITNSFMERYLGSFPSFEAFERQDQEYQDHLDGRCYGQLRQRMLRWYADDDHVTDYQMWGKARILRLDAWRCRYLKYDDVPENEQREWHEKLSECKTFAEAETAVSASSVIHDATTRQPLTASPFSS